MSRIPGSVSVAGFIAPSDSTDTYPSHDAAYGRGGHREVPNIVERDAIPADRRREGMTVYVFNEGLTYQLKGGLTNSNWAVMKTDVSSFEHNQLVPSTTWNIAHNLGKIPSVMVIESTGEQVFGEIAYPSLNVVVLTFSVPILGNAYLT